jgi:anti-anti-sigma factor
MAGDDRQLDLGALRVDSARDGSRHVVALAGELDIITAAPLADEITRVEATEADRIVIDLSEVRFIDSTGIKLLLQVSDRNADGDRLRLVRAPDEVHRVLRVAGIESRLPFGDE